MTLPANTQSGYSILNQPCGIEQLSVVVENSLFLFAVRVFLVYKGKTKGGEAMKIKVNVRAGKSRA